MRRSFILAGGRHCHHHAGCPVAPRQCPAGRCSACRSASSNAAAVQASASSSASVTNLGCDAAGRGHAGRTAMSGPIRKVGLDLGITAGIGAGLGRVCAGSRGSGPGDLSGKLCRRTGQRDDRRRPRRQCSGGRLGQFDRFAAASASRGRSDLSVAAGLESPRNFGREGSRGSRLCLFFPLHMGEGKENHDCSAATFFSGLPNRHLRGRHRSCRPNQGPSSR